MAEAFLEGSPAPGGTPLGRVSRRGDARRLSCGIVILNAQHELLLCHVTGQDHWDLPKGGAHSGETPMQTALRETREETGLALPADKLLDLGRMHYRPKKDLHLFAALVPRFDATQLQCEDRSCPAKIVLRPPEMDGFSWMGFECIAESCMPKLAVVLNERLNLVCWTRRELERGMPCAPHSTSSGLKLGMPGTRLLARCTRSVSERRAWLAVGPPGPRVCSAVRTV